MRDNDFKREISKYKFFPEQKIKVIKKIGEGGFGKVYSGVYTKLNIAIKEIKHKNEFEKERENFLKELYVLKRLQHPLVPAFYGLNHNLDSYSKRASQPIKQNNIRKSICKENFANKKLSDKAILNTFPNYKICIISELIRGQTFDNYVYANDLPIVQVLIHLIDFSAIVLYCHQMKIIHRDLKPENIMIDNKLNIKLLDYGISKIYDNNETITKTVGTVRYMPPESFRIIESESTYYQENSKCLISAKSDVWAFGCIIQELTTRTKPWDGMNDHQIMGMLYKESSFPLSEKLKDLKLRALIENCTKVNPNERYSMVTVKRKLIEVLYDKIKNRNIDVGDLLGNIDILNSRFF